jgi:hypothetical protein
MTTPERIISDNVSQMIAAAGIGVISPTASYAATDVAIVPGSIPAAPDKAIVITVVPLTDDITLPLGRVMVQVKIRGAAGDPFGASDLSSAVRDVLHGQKDLYWGPVHVIQMNRQIAVPNGQDASKRQEQFDQYYLDVDFPPTINRPAGGSW